MTLFTIRWGKEEERWKAQEGGDGNGYSNIQPGSLFHSAAFQNASREVLLNDVSRLTRTAKRPS